MLRKENDLIYPYPVGVQLIRRLVLVATRTGTNNKRTIIVISSHPFT